MTPLDGRDRIQLLKKLAYTATSGSMLKGRAETTAQAQIDLMGFGKVDARQALLETARFYGILVPTEDGWEFVHRTVHDYLAASYWVRTGGFAARAKHEWNARTAYAACLVEDATPIFQAALRAPDGMASAAEMLNNGAPLQYKAAAEALHAYFSNPGRATILSEPDSSLFTVTLSSDFICGAGTKLLDRMIDVFARKRTPVGDVLLAYCVLELRSRSVRLEHVTYDAVREAYGEDFAFQAPAMGNLVVRSMAPRSSLPRLLSSRKTTKP